MRSLCILLALPFAAHATDFSKEVYPVLQRACFECHGPEKQKGNLRLDTKAATEHKAITVGKPDASDLIRRIALPATDKEAMPKRGPRLKPAEIEHLKSWIAEGAKWPIDLANVKHWAYQKPIRPSIPKVLHPEWCKTNVDRFILAKLEADAIKPANEAEAAVLIRRLSLDLTGLPPKLEDVLAFEKNHDATAYEALVDRLLASKDFGVRWARPWLDLARYADSHGYQRDDLREIWGYRDWVVNALNADMPFDQFTIEQVAGDLLPEATPDQIVATGFHRCTPTNVEAGTEPEESRINQVIDRVNTTGAVWLGTTLECCQCHNHKYDPFTQRDYYSLLSYFNNTDKEAERTNPKVPGSIQFKGTAFAMMSPEKEAERTQLELQLAKLIEQITVREQAVATANPKAAEVHVLRPSEFGTEEGSEYDVQDDGSVLLTGEAPDSDTYTFEADLPHGIINAIMIEALTHHTLPGEGPGRGDEARPNFVLQKFEASISTPSGKSVPLKFSEAQASFAQKGFDPNSLIGIGPDRGWAINPQFHKSHWAVFTLATPLVVSTERKLTLQLEQKFGARRTIGCLRVSTISGDVASALPEKVADEPVAVAAKGRKAKAADKPQGKFSSDPQLAALQRQRNNVQARLNALKPANTEVMHELAEPRMTSIFKRGEYTAPGDPVTATVPAIFNSKVTGPTNRLTLAKWLASRENPLAARVTVNRWWAEIFGQGIVTTAEDFGIKGEAPTHPELLDWLAVELMDHGWSMKHILKEMVMSATYRQSVAGNAEGARRYASGPRFRLDAEMIRDNALAIAGLLSLKQGGPPIRPPQPDGLWKKVGGQDYKYEVSPGDEQYRRGLYVVLKRGSPYPSFVNFDACARMASVVKRSRSNTPLQALTLLNDPVYVEATKAFARRIVKQAPSNDVDARLTFAVRTALARAPEAKELAVLKHLWESQLDDAKAMPQEAKELAAGFDLQGIPAEEFAAWYAVASALLNLDECITKG